MEIIKFFVNILRAPVIAGAFCIILAVPTYAAETKLWQDQPHPAAPYLTAKFGTSYLYRDLAGYGDLESSTADMLQYNIELSSGAEIPLLSRIYWSSTQDIHFNPDEFLAADSSHSSYSSLIELKSPFTANFLSHDTTFFFQYRNNGSRYGIQNQNEVTLHNGQVYNSGSKMTVGEQSQFFALAIDTPITNNDSGNSYSRFGIYYQLDERLRHATVNDVSDEFLLGVAEHQFGVFVDILKPVFTKGFFLHTYFQLGYGLRSVDSNSMGFKNTTFEGHSSLFIIQTEIEAAYRFNLSENTGLTLLAGYKYNNTTVLQNGSSNSGSFEEDARNQFKGSLVFDINF